MTTEEIVAAVNACCAGNLTNHQPAVVITGGEPFRQNLSRLVEQLDYDGITVQIETNGTLPIPRDVFDRSMIVCSPKTGKVANPAYVHAWKYVMHHESIDPEDGLPTRVLDHSVSKRVARKGQETGQVYLQPMDSRDPEDNKKSLDACVQSCMKFGYTLCLQIHKIANLP
jgi:organic radical activating enzyme